MDRKITDFKYTAIFETQPEGGYTVFFPALPGCITEGDTFEEALEMAKDAVKAYLGSLIKLMSRTIKTGTLLGILKQANLTKEDLLK